MMRHKKGILTLLCVFCFLVIGQSQDFVGIYNGLKERLQNDPAILTGGISSDFSYNYFSDTTNRQQPPIAFRISSNLSLDIMKINIPVNFEYSNGGASYGYTLPSYSFKGLSPTYKWATLHLGDRNMNFSKYTFAGIGFYGIGVELKPEKFGFSAFYGRLQKATSPALTNVSGLESSYNRVGWGVKLDTRSDKSSSSFIYFTASDDEDSILEQYQSTIHTPSANSVIGVNTKNAVSNSVDLNIEYGLSIYTKDKSAGYVNQLNGTKKVLNYFTPIKTSTVVRHAVKSGLSFKIKETNSLKIDFEHIDPEYKTLGGVFFQNNLENYTVGTQNVLFQKIQVAANVGIQKTDVGKSSNSQTTAATDNTRFIGNINLGLPLGKRTNTNFTYSNFNNTAIIHPIQLPGSPTPEELSQLVQLNNNFSFNFSSVLGESNSSVITGMWAYQNAVSIQDEEIDWNQFTEVYMSNLSFSKSNKEKKSAYTASLLLNNTKSSQGPTISIIPSIMYKGPMLKEKLNITSTLSYARILSEHLSSSAFSFSLGTNIKVYKEHQLGLKINAALRENAGIPISNFSTRLTYSRNFEKMNLVNLFKKKNKEMEEESEEQRQAQMAEDNADM